MTHFPQKTFRLRRAVFETNTIEQSGPFWTKLPLRNKNLILFLQYFQPFDEKMQGSTSQDVFGLEAMNEHLNFFERPNGTYQMLRANTRNVIYFIRPNEWMYVFNTFRRVKRSQLWYRFGQPHINSKKSANKVSLCMNRK